MTFACVIERLKAEPELFLDSFCVLSLGAFLCGYKYVDSSAYDPVRDLLDVFPGSEQASACTRAYLSYPDSSAGASAILDALARGLKGSDARPEDGRVGARTFIELLRDPILGKRPAMLLAEPTVVILYNYVRGFLSGLESVSPVEAAAQKAMLADFERWLQERYLFPCAAWYKLIRIHGGACERGLIKFIELWDEFEKVRSLS